MACRFWLDGRPLAEADTEQLAIAVLESVVKHENESQANPKD